MAAYDDILTRVRENLLDVPTVTTNRVPRLVQNAQRKFEDGVDLPVLEAVLDLTTASGVRSLGSKPSDWIRRRAKPSWHDGSGAVRHFPDVDWIDTDLEIRQRYSYAALDTGSPRHIHELETTFEVYPLPNALAAGGSLFTDGNYRVHIPYWKRLATLSTGGSNWFTTNAADALEWEATAAGFEINFDEDRANFWHRKANDEMKRLRRREALAKLTPGFAMGYSTSAAGRPNSGMNG